MSGDEDAGRPPRVVVDGGMARPVVELPTIDPDAVVIANLDSAIINVEPVEGARDYRAFALGPGVERLVDSDGRELVRGATIFCAGQRQRAAPALPAEPMTQIEVTGVTETTEFVVEAIDEPCPFPGLFGRVDASFEVANHGIPPELSVPVPILSEASIRARYGSMIFNGHGAGAQPGQPAEPVDPHVLASHRVVVTPLAGDEAARRRTADFFADFADDQPFEYVPPGPTDPQNDDGSYHSPPNYGYMFGVYQSRQFTAYVTHVQFVRDTHIFVDRGVVQTILPDQSQDVMGTVMLIPRRPAPLADDRYVHVTFESTGNSTARRYWWLSLCGADEPGATFTEDERLVEPIILGSGFWNDDAQNPSVAGWNCLFAFPHDGLGAPVPADGTNPESSIIVALHRANTDDGVSAVNLSPEQISGFPNTWYRQMEGGQVTHDAILDDLVQEAPRARFDFFISRRRLVMYVNGEQRVCNDFGPERLTMAEAAIGFNTALYHSAAERDELQLDFADRTGQRYYLENSPFADQHAWDNLGFEVGVDLPASFVEDCYTHGS